MISARETYVGIVRTCRCRWISSRARTCILRCTCKTTRVAPARGPDSTSHCPFYGKIMERASRALLQRPGRPLKVTVYAAGRSSRPIGYESRWNARRDKRGVKDTVGAEGRWGDKEEVANILRSRRGTRSIIQITAIYYRVCLVIATPRWNLDAYKADKFTRE